MNKFQDRNMERLEHSLLSGKISRRMFVTTAMASGILAAGVVNALADELDCPSKARRQAGQIA